MAQSIYAAALSDADKKRIAELAKTQGAAAASSLALQMANKPTETSTPPIGATTGAVTNTGGAVPAQVQTAQAQAQALRAQQEQQRALQQAQQSGNIQAVNQILREQTQQQSIQAAQQSGNAQLAAQLKQAAEAQARANALNSGATPAPAQNPYQAALAQASQTVQPVTNKDYLVFGNPAAGFKSGMSAEDQASWDAIGKKYAAGDTSWNRDTNQFRDEGNWGSYYDANGNINGWLYAGDGTGGYAPVFGGKLGETGYKAGTVFYSPDGKAYTLGADGSLTQSGNVEWAPYGSYIGPQAGYQDSSFWALENGEYKKYTNQTAPDSVLEAQGYYRDANGLVMPINNDYYIAKGVQSGQITPEQLALAQAVQAQGSNPQALPNTQLTVQPTVQSAQPIQNTPQYTQAPQTTQNSQLAKPLPQDQQVQTQTVSRIDPNAFQAYLDQWSYEPAPEWTGGQDETWKEIYNYDYGEAPTWEGSQYDALRDEALQRALGMQYTDDEYIKKRDQLLEDALKPWEGSQYDALRDRYLQDAAGMSWNGSQYDPLRDAALARYGEEWQGSEYQRQRDEALRRAQDMQFNYDPNTDVNWQALQKQYRREGDRATQEALAQASQRTGGVANSYAATAAAQAGNYYAAQLSDRLPQLYNDAYNRYLQEFQRQLGISDQYAGFDDREYARWADQQGKNLDLADRYNQYGQQEYGQFQDEYGRRLDAVDRYNQYGQQEYGQYQDRVSQQLAGADRYNDYDRTNYQRFLDEYGREMDAVDRYNQYGQQEYGQYQDRLGQFNTDRNFQYGLNRDYVSDAERANQTAYNRYLDSLDQYNRDRAMSYEQFRDAVGDMRYDDETQYARNYQAQRDAILDNRADREWAQELRAYADAQGWKQAEWEQYLREYGDQLSEKERQWAYQMSRDAVSDNRWERQYADQRSDTMYERALYDQEYADQRGDTTWEQNYKQTAYNDALEDAALDYLNTNGIVTGRYAEILGVPDGTTYEQYYSRYLGGGSSSPFDETEIPSGTTPKYTPPPGGGDEGGGDETPAGPPVTVTLPELKSRYGNDTAMEVWSYAGRPWYVELHELAQTNMAAALDRIYDLTRQGEVSKDENAQKALMEMLGITEAALDYEAPKYGGSTGLYATYNAKGGNYKDKNFVNIPG